MYVLFGVISIQAFRSEMSIEVRQNVSSLVATTITFYTRRVPTVEYVTIV